MFTGQECQDIFIVELNYTEGGGVQSQKFWTRMPECDLYGGKSKWRSVMRAGSSRPASLDRFQARYWADFCRHPNTFEKNHIERTNGCQGSAQETE